MSKIETNQTAVKETKLSSPCLRINAVSNWVNLAINALVALVLTRFIISQVGQIGFGVWTLVCSFIGYYELLNLGVGSALTRHIARYSSRGDHESMNKTASTAIAMFCCTGLLTVVVSFLIAGPLAAFFKIEAGRIAEFKYLVWILGVTTAIGFAGSVFGAITRAHERFVAMNIVDITRALTRAILVVLFLYKGWGLVGMGCATLAASVLSYAASIGLCRYYVPGLSLRLEYVRGKMLKRLLIYGSITTVIILANILRVNVDSFIIGKWINMSSVGIYGIAALLIRYAISLITAATVVLNPRFASIEARNDLPQLKRIFLKSLSVSAVLSGIVVMLLLSSGGNFINLWVGPKFNGAIPVLSILGAAWFLDLAQNPGIGLMFAMNKHHLYAVATLAEAVLNVTISILLVGKFGMLGVATGTLISMTLVKLFIQPIYVARLIGISVNRYFKALIAPGAVGVIMVCATRYMGVARVDNCQGYLSLAFQCVVLALLFLFVLALVSKDNRQLILDSMRSKGGFLAKESQGACPQS